MKNFHLLFCFSSMVKTKTKVIVVLLLFNAFFVFNSSAQTIPFVYDVENTGDTFAKPVLPTKDQLPVIKPLTDPFIWSDGSGRSTNFSDWSHRRAEIAAEIQNYEIGPKPKRPDTITASYSGGVLTVVVTENGKTLTLKSQVVLPSGTGPFPAVIGMNSGTGSLPANLFTSNGVATITYNHNDVTIYNGKGETNPYFLMYPDLNYAGQYSAWAWGVSRLIDGLELVQNDLKIDLKHLAVTGCSYAGKMALFAGALDERIALTIPQESGGGGAAAWRVSESLIESVERISNTNNQWFMSSMLSTSAFKLPHDHHELLAMVAPRALLVLGNNDMIWLADESGYVSCRAAEKVYETFGISDRIGFSIVGGHGHCALPSGQYPEVTAYIKKFLLGDSTANTNVRISPYQYVDYGRWTAWWGTGVPEFPVIEGENLYEGECAKVGKNWEAVSYNDCSNKTYITAKTGISSTSAAPTDSANIVYIPFTIDKDSTYVIFARVNCPSGTADSYWVKVDDSSFVSVDGLSTSGWKWRYLNSYKLTAGEHTLAIGINENGALLDKISITPHPFEPSGMGKTAVNNCGYIESFFFEPECATKGIDWRVGYDTLASNNGYLAVRPDTESVAAAPATKAGEIFLKYNSTLNAKYYVYGRVDCPSANDDSYWVKFDSENYESVNGLVTSGWEWKFLASDTFTAGTHSFTIAYRENGAKLDKVCISNSALAPTGIGGEASKGCKITDIEVMNADGYSLEQNYPNPVMGKTSISFEIPKSTFVSLKVYNMLGVQITELAGKNYPQGKHVVTFDAKDLSNGMYYYTLKTDQYTMSRKMILKNK